MIETFSRFIARLISFITDLTSNFIHNIDVSQYSFFQVALDILFVAIIFYWIIMMIRGTRATNITIGLVVLGLVFALSKLAHLIALGWLLDRLLTVTLVAIPIIFQQELRRGLEKLGHTKFFVAEEAKEVDITRSQLISACFKMAEAKVGALIVMQGEVNLNEYLDTGVAMDAQLSKELLVSIFQKGSPLHDGAVVISDSKILAAGCILPHSFKEYGHSFGTRHKSALALSESTDAHIFVISEENGAVSHVTDGKIERDIKPERMERLITKILLPKKRLSPLTHQSTEHAPKSSH